MENRVVGVNTQGLSKERSEGMNFAVHFSEVQDFLNKQFEFWNFSVSNRRILISDYLITVNITEVISATYHTVTVIVPN